MRGKIISVIALFAILGCVLYAFQPGQDGFLKKTKQHQEGELPELVHDHHHGFKCVHDEFIAKHKDEIHRPEKLEESPIEATLAHELKLRKEQKHDQTVGTSGNWRTIRILADYTNLQSQPVAYQNFISRQLMPAAVAFLQSGLQVYPKSSITEVIGRRSCINTPINAQHSRNGIPNTDLVLYVTASSDSDNWLARAGACIFDRQTGRPVAGMVEFNLNYVSKLRLNDASDTSWYGWVSTTVHEVTHVLGFSSSDFPNYINPQTNRPLGQSNVVRSAYGRNWIVLPNVVQQTKDYFNCPNAWGAPLEDQGGSGTAGSHWERVTFGNEAMTGSDMPDPSYSDFTFQLLQGTGWYLTNRRAAQPFFWGKGEGCGIASGKCSAGTAEFCSATKANQCSIDFTSIAACDNRDELSDGCGYWQGYSNADCRVGTQFTNSLSQYTGGRVGDDSRCWKSSFLTMGLACYKSECAPDQRSIYVSVGGTNYTCTQDNQVINVRANGRSGQITCPVISRFCAYYNRCPGQCSGKGTCRGQTCDCWTGFTGADCSRATQ